MYKGDLIKTERLNIYFLFVSFHFFFHLRIHHVFSHGWQGGVGKKKNEKLQKNKIKLYYIILVYTCHLLVIECLLKYLIKANLQK